MSRRKSTAPGDCPQAVLDLAARFHEHREAYRQQTYNEAQVRREFIDPLFAALGWDIDNEAGLAEAYKDVIHEDAIKVGGSTKAPDYCFRIGGTRKFFVEAKKPAVGVATDPGPAYQVRRYAWSNKLPLSIVTDFEEFAVYDCRIRPKATDKASTARVLYCTYDQYADKWAEIASIFSKDAILKGSFDKYAASTRRKRGTAEVDAEFLKEISAWRTTLASHLALRNRRLSVRELNYAVSRIIDRIIFLRMCEDRGIETYAQLRDLLNGKAVYRRLVELFHRADDRYNSGLFHFQPERDRPEAPDELTPDLKIDDKILKDILRTLYYPESPYEFSVLPTEILGQVYEQFLGQVIRLTKAHRAVVEDKPEVKKAGGVYYTPRYIVDYIVKHTVGKLLEGKTPKQAARLRILDPACGSGSFLLGAYQYMLDWHLDYYTTHDPAKWTRGKAPPIYRVPTPDPRSLTPGYRLTIQEKKRILLNNIYGVDIDAQAVEVTKLSLLLKVLENETAETLGRTLRLFHERALPDLAANIKCGNSLIGPDFYDDQQMTLLDEEEQYRINAFDWEAEFPQVYEQNRAHKGTAKQNPERKRRAKHAAAPDGAGPVAHARGSDQALDPDAGFDAVIGNPPYLSFSGRQAIELSQVERVYFGRHYESAGWPTSHGLFMERALKDLSRRFSAFIVPDQVGHLDGYQSVRKAITQRAGLAEVRYWGEAVFNGVVTPALTFVANKTFSGSTFIQQPDGGRRSVKCEGGDAWTAPEARDLLAKLRSNSHSLAHLVADPGVHTGNCSKKLILPAGEAEPGCVPVLEGKQVSRYGCDRPAKALKLDYSARQGEYFTIRPRHKYTDAPFVIRQTAAYPIVGPRVHADYFRNSLLALYRPKDGTDVRYLVGLLNSRLIRYAYRQTVHESRQKAFPQVKVRSLRALLLRRIDPAEPSDRARHDRMVALVQQMLDLHKRLATARTPTDKTAMQRQIDATDRQIDQVVYELYGLSDDEIRIVEEATT